MRWRKREERRRGRRTVASAPMPGRSSRSLLRSSTIFTGAELLGAGRVRAQQLTHHRLFSRAHSEKGFTPPPARKPPPPGHDYAYDKIQEDEYISLLMARHDANESVIASAFCFRHAGCGARSGIRTFHAGRDCLLIANYAAADYGLLLIIYHQRRFTQLPRRSRLANGVSMNASPVILRSRHIATIARHISQGDMGATFSSLESHFSMTISARRKGRPYARAYRAHYYYYRRPWCWLAAFISTHAWR